MAAALSLAPTDIKPFSNDEPRILDLRVAERLGMAQLRSVRTLIAANRNELEMHGEILMAATTKSLVVPSRGRPGKEYWLNEGQVLVICMLSRTPQAAQVRKEVIEVFMAYRRAAC